MIKSRNKFIALALAAALLLSSVLFAAFAEDPSGGGPALQTDSSPYSYHLYFSGLEPNMKDNPNADPADPSTSQIADGTYNMKLSLYLIHDNNSPKIDGGYCGVEFPARIKNLKFEPSEFIDIKDSYDPSLIDPSNPSQALPDPGNTEIYLNSAHFFRWVITGSHPEDILSDGFPYSYVYDENEKVLNSAVFPDIRGEEDPQSPDPQNPQVIQRSFQSIPGGCVSLYMGDYTFNIGNKYPTQGSVNCLDWINEAQEISQNPNTDYYPSTGTPDNTEDLDFIPSEDVWDPDYDNGSPKPPGAYIGYYVNRAKLPETIDPDPGLPGVGVPEPGEPDPPEVITTEQVRIPFVFEDPDYWPLDESSVLIGAFDPKKPITVSVYEEHQDVLGNLQNILVAEKEYAYDAALDPQAGYFTKEVDLNKLEPKVNPDAAVSGGLYAPDASQTYTFVFGKPAHLSCSITGVCLAGSSFGDVTLTKDLIYLPAGDINGDGAISLSDYALINSAVNKNDRFDYTKTGDPDYIEYYLDLDGDLKISTVDSAIAANQSNYNKRNISKPWTPIGG